MSGAWAQGSRTEPAMLEFVAEPFKREIRDDAECRGGLEDLAIGHDGITAYFREGTSLFYGEGDGVDRSSAID